MRIDPFTMVLGIVLVVAIASLVRARWTGGTGRGDIASLHSRIARLEARLAELERAAQSPISPECPPE